MRLPLPAHGSSSLSEQPSHGPTPQAWRTEGEAPALRFSVWLCQLEWGLGTWLSPSPSPSPVSWPWGGGAQWSRGRAQHQGWLDGPCHPPLWRSEQMARLADPTSGHPSDPSGTLYLELHSWGASTPVLVSPVPQVHWVFSHRAPPWKPQSPPIPISQAHWVSGPWPDPAGQTSA